MNLWVHERGLFFEPEVLLLVQRLDRVGRNEFPGLGPHLLVDKVPGREPVQLDVWAASRFQRHQFHFPENGLSGFQVGGLGLLVEQVKELVVPPAGPVVAGGAVNVPSHSRRSRQC